LRSAQQLALTEGLSAYRITLDQLSHLDQLFERDAAVWLEIGFGGGEHAAWQALTHPTVGIIGCEVFQPGIVQLVSRLEREQIANLRILDDDAREALTRLPDNSLDRAFVLFPDPWPKTRHHKRRLISPAIMDEFARVLHDGSELRLATDDVAYLRVMLSVACSHPAFEWLARHKSDWCQRPDDWPQTRYEAKAIEAGRPPAFLRLQRRSRGEQLLQSPRDTLL
jgi:tRNA (guanine-N7-)-methyltransferase